MQYVKKFGVYIDTDCNIYSKNRRGQLYRLPWGPGGCDGAYDKVSFFPVDEHGNRGTRQVKAFVHRIIATAFVPNPEGKPTVDHINRNGHDNRPENLRWVSAKEQQRNRTVCDITKSTLGVNWYEDPKLYRKRRWERLCR